jgi:hypothetical protein
VRIFFVVLAILGFGLTVFGAVHIFRRSPRVRDTREVVGVLENMDGGDVLGLVLTLVGAIITLAGGIAAAAVGPA